MKRKTILTLALVALVATIAVPCYRACRPKTEDELAIERMEAVKVKWDAKFDAEIAKYEKLLEDRSQPVDAQIEYGDRLAAARKEKTDFDQKSADVLRIRRETANQR